MTIGQRIAQKRKEQGLSQEALGEQLGVSRQSIYKWESDAALPEIEKLITLSRLFGVSVGWLLGVEEDAVPTAEENEELTETQLKIVEEIVSRYLAAQPQPKKLKKWPFVLAVLLVGALFIHMFNQLDEVSYQTNNLQQEINRVQNNVGYQINGISSRVEEILKAQNSLTADYTIEHVSSDPSKNTAHFSFRAIPKSFSKGMKAWIEAETGDEKVSFGPFSPDGQTFSGEVDTPLTDSISIYIVFESNGTRETQLLNGYSGLYSETLPYVAPNFDNLMWDPVGTDGIFAIPNSVDSSSRYISLMKDEVNNPDISTIRVGLFKNQSLVAWAKPCDKPKSFQGFENETFYALPDMQVPITKDDTVGFAVILTDRYNRTIVCPGSFYTLDPEDNCLTFAENPEIDEDPTHWNFE